MLLHERRCFNLVNIFSCSMNIKHLRVFKFNSSIVNHKTLLRKLSVSQARVFSRDGKQNRPTENEIKDMFSFLERILLFNINLHIFNFVAYGLTVFMLVLPIGSAVYLAHAIHEEGDKWQSFVVNVL